MKYFLFVPTITIAILIIIFFSSKIEAQHFNWNPTYGPFGGSIIQSTITVQGHIFAIMYSGIFRSTDYGKSWSYQILQNNVDELTCITSDLSGSLFVGTNYNGIWRSTDNGDSWSQLKSSFALWKVQSLSLGNRNDLYAVIEQGVAHYIGGEWTMTSLNENYLQCVAVDTSGKVLVANNGKLIYSSSNMGLTWRTDSIPVYYMRQINFGKNGIYIISPSDGIYLSSDSLKGWKSLNGDLPDKTVWSFAELGTGELLAGVYKKGIFLSSDQGVHWSRTDSNYSTSYVVSIIPRLKDTVFAAISNGILLRNISNQCWIPVGIPNSSIQKLKCDSRGVIYASGSGGLWKSSTQGKSWENVWSKTNVRNLFISDDDRIVFTDGIFKVYLSTNEGKIFSEISAIIPNGQIQSLLLNRDNYLFLGYASFGIIRSTDFGLTWSRTDFSNRDAQDIIENERGDLFALIYGKNVYRSNDGGNSWLPFNEGIEKEYITRINTNKHGYIYAQNYMGNLFRISYDGKQWEKLSSNVNMNSITSVYIYGPQNIFVTTERDGIYLSTDYGISWQQENNGLSDRFINSVVVDLSGMIYAGSSFFGVFRAQGSLTLVTKEPEVSSFAIQEIYPNPFRASTTITFSLSRPEKVEVSVFDLLGREVKTLFDGEAESGSHTVQFNAGHLPNGVYQVVLQSGKNVDRKNVVVMR